MQGAELTSKCLVSEMSAVRGSTIRACQASQPVFRFLTRVCARGRDADPTSHDVAGLGRGMALKPRLNKKDLEFSGLFKSLTCASL